MSCDKNTLFLVLFISYHPHLTDAALEAQKFNSSKHKYIGRAEAGITILGADSKVFPLNQVTYEAQRAEASQHLGPHPLPVYPPEWSGMALPHWFV